MYKLVIFTPCDNAQGVADAMFEAGAGKVGSYDKCCFISKGIGQFRPLEGSNPHIGKQNELEFVEEARIEMVCNETSIKDVVKAMKESHPYETPAYDVIKLEDF
ncbi:MAG: NGG1p interacting factor NIF3 [Bacteriovoracaceae bacterium]|nr:NGG1p interacting factor NIF3 [Bacteriovoracaceae bacterium]